MGVYFRTMMDRDWGDSKEYKEVKKRLGGGSSTYTINDLEIAKSIIENSDLSTKEIVRINETLDNMIQINKNILSSNQSSVKKLVHKK